MSLRFAVPATVAALLSLAALATAQTGPPPVKMGLWQHDVTVDMSGMPDGENSSHTVSKQSCMTPDTWKQSFQSMQNQHGPAGVSCTNDNMQQDEHHFSFDATCTVPQGMNMKVHVDMTLDSNTAMHGDTTTTMSGPNMPQEMTVHATIHSKFLNADCGSVKPDSPKPPTP